MDIKQKVEDLKEQWKEASSSKKTGIIVVVVVVVFIFWLTGQKNKTIQTTKKANAQTSAKVDLASPNQLNANGFKMPESNRNQGLEDQAGLVQSMRDDVKLSADRATAAESAVASLTKKLDQALGGKSTLNNSSATVPAVDLNNSLPPPAVDFSQPGASPSPAAKAGGNGGSSISLTPSRNTSISVVEAPVAAAKPKEEIPPISLPRNTIIESVMLSGINARTNSAGGTTGGSVTSANNVGSPFIARIKGNAMLPNGWKVADLESCFIGGSGIGILSTERANVISDSISCVDKQGRIFEAKVKAYGVDADGVQGLAGKLVTKQGSILAKMALAGIASGLGSAFTPQATASFSNTSGQQNGSSQSYTVPNAQFVAGNAVGQGLNQSMTMLAKFYLSYAQQIFPVVEVNAGTRVTWILQEGVDLVSTTGKQSTLK